MRESERVRQQVAAHPQGLAAAPAQAGGVLLLVHERLVRWLEIAVTATVSAPSTSSRPRCAA
ncbi:hypothetical protein, partial [Streptomyces sp. CO7]